MTAKGVKKVTVDELARMTQNGFSSTEKTFKNELAEQTKVILAEFQRVNAEIKDLKPTRNASIVITSEHERQIQTIESRLDHVERKVGIGRLSR